MEATTRRGEGNAHSSSRTHKDKKHKKHKSAKHRESSKLLGRHSSNSKGPSEGGANKEFYELLENMRVQTKERKRRRKELLKSVETAAEKRARRLAKKKAKQLKHSFELGWPGEYMVVGYSNDDNPYGDPELTHPFVWGKKLEKEGLSNISDAELASRSRQVLEANRVQLEKIKMDRVMRDRLKSDAEMMRRDRDGQQNFQWTEQEARFHLEQARERSKIRLQDNRARAIDHLAAYIYCLMEGEDWVDDEYLFSEPQTYCENLSLSDCEDLVEDIDVYKRLQEGAYDQFWNNILVVVHDHRKQEAVKSGLVPDSRQAVSSAVMGDIERIFEGKAVEQLIELETHVVAKIDSAEDGLDIAYWELLLSLLRVRIAVTQLLQLHQKLAETNGDRMICQSKAEPPRGGSEIKLEQGASQTPGPSCSTGISTRKFRSLSELESRVTDDEMIKAYREGGYSPVYVSKDSIPTQARVIGLKKQVTKFTESNISSAEKESIEAFENFARKGMGEDEATFAVEHPVEQQDVMRWSDRFLPRKPRYFNRVHTGFEWNKYNQTHYDLDNPPPKIVQGYKFNVFYPDLLDPTPPKFTIIPCKDDSDFCIIKFHAGPPYEASCDVAFKIVKREWEISQKKGYRCIFQNGIFQLWFQFKKYRYRR
ncbi:CactinC cactus and Cactin mid domain containing p rotein [Trichuris trichiura]|uniref:Splicing factor Cactin n=1 Tax=Trichuris trichiura TaxID=36087 RepID=A0A077Z802_TRITR|nr:CactinC cactus and Cactin mid domain containing p rotein [Trichuris trichiura]